MRPACRFLNAPVFVKLVESSVGISLQRAAELPQVPLGVLAFAIRRIGKPHGGRGLISCRTIIANIRPQPPRLGLAVAAACTMQSHFVQLNLVRTCRITLK